MPLIVRKCRALPVQQTKSAFTIISDSNTSGKSLWKPASLSIIPSMHTSYTFPISHLKTLQLNIYIYAHVLHSETYVTYATYCPQVPRLPRVFLVKCMLQLAFGRSTGARPTGAILLMLRLSTQLIASTPTTCYSVIFKRETIPMASNFTSHTALQTDPHHWGIFLSKGKP